MQRRRAPDLDALADHDLVAERDPPVTRQMERERPGGRAGRRILRDAVGRDEDARLPALAVAGEAARSVGIELQQRGDVGAERGHGRGRAELDEDVARALAVELDRQPGLLHAEQAE